MLFEALLASSLTVPRPNAECYGSPPAFQIATGNTPYTNDPSTRWQSSPKIDAATTVVNIWAFLQNGTPPATAWLYKNASGTYVVQVNYQHADVARKALESAKYGALFDQGADKRYMAPMIVTNTEMTDIEKRLSHFGVRRTACFISDWHEE